MYKPPQKAFYPYISRGYIAQQNSQPVMTLVCHLKKVMHRGWAYFQARLAFTMAAFNVLVQWHGLRPYASGFVPLSIAEFSL
jgi:hypothetical protein